jgi:hypothetical protein
MVKPSSKLNTGNKDIVFKKLQQGEMKSSLSIGNDDLSSSDRL